MEITVRTAAGTAPPPLRRALAAAGDLLRNVGRPDAEVSVLLTDDAEIRALNRAWRGIDAPTDVLSWPQEEPGAAIAGSVLGDVAISLDTARRQAGARGWDAEEEVALLLVHGILHLLGHEDDTAAGARAMRARERAILGRPLTKPEPGA